jgi:acetyltransferase-like isoleucine patch superfamily enzyme
LDQIIMKKAYILLLFLGLVGSAQTGIGTPTPHSSAKLEVAATNKGFLPPRVTLTSTTDATTIASPAEGLLVYNLGSVGLQAGYYFWNGANWATIATGSLAGNAVVASDLVKLYSEVYSNATGKISNTSGYSFTVPVSGRYLFDFSSTTWGGNSTTTFKVRLGTTDLGTDSQTSLNNNVHVEYNGKIEVNLQAGITYNVALTTNANRDSGDYDRVYYKMVAGNLPINQYTVGDVKTGIQTGDHNGWVKLDGRLKSNLTASQQTQANLLGIGTNLPDATNAVLMQSNGTLGTITGSMSTTIAQNQLPNIAPTITVNSTVATMQNGGYHDHPIRVVPSSTGGYASGNASAFKNLMAPTTEADADITDRIGNAYYVTTGIIGSGGTHTHTIDSHNHTATSTSINGGVTQQAIDKTPRSLVVNTFIYLGY